MLADIVAVLLVTAAAVSFGLFAPLLYDYARYKFGVFRINLGAVTGYAEKYSFRRGEPIDLYIHSTQPTVLTKLRLADGWQAIGAPAKLDRQMQDARYDRRTGLLWSKTITIDSSKLEPGLYQFLLQHEHDENARFSIPIIVKDDQSRPLSVVLATNTWDAYNTFGGLSHYENHYAGAWSKRLATFLRRANLLPDFAPRKRPNRLFSEEVTDAIFDKTYSSFQVRNELEFLVFLERCGYAYNVYSDEDLAHDPRVGDANGLVFPGHSEYWAPEMFYAFERFVLQGGKIYRTVAGMEGFVRFEPLGLKFLPRPPDWIPDVWVGTHTDDRGQFTAAPFRALHPESWVFAGTDLKRGDLFGADSANRPSFDIPGHQHLRATTNLEGQPQNGASGFFMSKVGPGSGPFSILAVGTNPQGGAQMAYRDHPAGGWVFNSSSISFPGALFRDQAVARIVRNLLDDAVNGRPAPRAGSRRAQQLHRTEEVGAR